ncbi:hypothetical protein AVEN_108003-1 [Araneus ventricosus]|uniref:Histone-lysine N-methyltransferase SETMAR n=1 Tax=Araneus ventricosus TaxID=182803 RepID=A0A4Y2DV91_ARAVE|nr:hypothetical protein AVEN_108003-1 [Araneus ventricosus]
MLIASSAMQILVKCRNDRLYKNISGNVGSRNSVLVTDLSDVSWSRKPTKVDNDSIKALIEQKHRCITQENAEILNIHHSTVHDHLKKVGYISKVDDIWVPHDPFEQQSPLA